MLDFLVNSYIVVWILVRLLLSEPRDRSALDTRRNHWKRKEEKENWTRSYAAYMLSSSLLESMLLCFLLLKFFPGFGKIHISSPSFCKVCTLLLHLSLLGLWTSPNFLRFHIFFVLAFFGLFRIWLLISSAIGESLRLLCWPSAKPITSRVRTGEPITVWIHMRQWGSWQVQKTRLSFHSVYM